MSTKNFNTKLIVIRHGKPEYEYQETADGKKRRLCYGEHAVLSEEGKKQASEIAERIPQLDTLYSSTLERAKQTAQIIAKKHDISSMKEIAELKEIVTKGVIGLPLDDVVQGKIIPPFLPGDETFEQLENRIIPAFKNILDLEKGKTAGIVAHGHGIRMMIFRLIEKNQGKLPDIQELEQYNYLNPGEAWLLEWDDQNNLIRQEIITRPETEIVGKRHS